MTDDTTLIDQHSDRRRDPIAAMGASDPEPPVEEPPYPPSQPPIEEPEKPPKGPFPPRQPPVEIPPDAPQESPVREPPPADPDRQPPDPSQRRVGRHSAGVR